MINEQVQMQLDYLKSLVDYEKQQEMNCKKWNIPYSPSHRKDENVFQYQAYKNEIEQNQDKNLLAFIKMNGENDINIYGTLPFARRYVNDTQSFVHRLKNGPKILFTKD